MSLQKSDDGVECVAGRALAWRSSSNLIFQLICMSRPCLRELIWRHIFVAVPRWQSYLMTAAQEVTTLLLAAPLLQLQRTKGEVRKPWTERDLKVLLQMLQRVKSNKNMAVRRIEKMVVKAFSKLILLSAKKEGKHGSAAYLGVRDSIGLIKTIIAFTEEEGKVVTWEWIDTIF